MKFSSTLQFNAVPEWREHYIDYDHLKDLIFRLERVNVLSSQDDVESLAERDPSVVFREAIDKEVKKVDSFYRELEDNALSEYDKLEEKMNAYLMSAEYRDQPSGPPPARHSESGASAADEDEGSDSSDDDTNVSPRRRPRVQVDPTQKTSIPFQIVNFKRETTRLFVLFNEMLNFSDLNREGVRKALKKFDKVHATSLLPEYMNSIGKYKVFSREDNQSIGKAIDRLVSNYAKLTGETDEKAQQLLSDLLREHVVYERNTVWRDLIGLERQAQGVQSGTGQQPAHTTRARKKGISRALASKPFRMVLIILVFLLILLVQPLESAVQSRCLAVVVTASILWATETLPLFVTSLMVPILVVILRIPLNEEGQPMPPKDASHFVFASMWSPVITVLLGGFALAAALSKYNIAKALAQAILTNFGSGSPRKIILVLMFVSAFLCMWISNVASPVLLFSVSQPLLRVLPHGDPFSKALILGIALASNIGGMSSPIASPQNILALQNMDPPPSWMEWFFVSLPVCIASLVLIWTWLCLTFPVTVDARNAMMHIRGPGSNHPVEFGPVHLYISGVTTLTILLWCFSHQLEPITGDMGVLALVPIVLLFGPGILSAADFNNFLWTIVALAMGGIVLGQSVESCGLLVTIARVITAKVAHLPLFAISLTFGFMILLVACFISHTVAALIILPLVKSIGEQLDDPHPRLLVMLSALLCSGAMALPTSGFPNVTAVCMVDELGKSYLSVTDFISKGIPASLIAYMVIVTVGYTLCRILGF